MRSAEIGEDEGESRVDPATHKPYALASTSTNLARARANADG